MKLVLYIISIVFFINNLEAENIQFEKDLLKIQTNNNEYIFNIEIATTHKQRSLGLMHRKTLDQNKGMIFIYPKEQIVKMWMKNTYIPLDMIFIKDNGIIESIIKMTKPRDLTPIGPNLPIKAVLELNGGITTYLNIKKGDIVIHKYITNSK